MPDQSMTALAIEGKDLLQHPVRVPADLPPGPCVLIFAFSPAHESEAKTWVPTLTDLATNGKATVRQVIVLHQLMKVVPEEARDATILAFGDQGAVARSAGAANTDHIAVALLDASRSVVWTSTGAHTPDAETALRARIAA